MLVLQQIDVLPAGAAFHIVDTATYKVEVAGEKSKIDNSLIFESAKEAELYNKVYSTFRVSGIDVSSDYGQAIDTVWIIKVR